jgi:hypothetical protein
MVRLLFSKKNGLLVLTDQEVFHPHVEDPGQGQEIIHCGQALPVLPFVNGLRVLEAEVGLQFPHAHARIAAATLDVAAGLRQINYRKIRACHHNHYLQAVTAII